MRDMQRAEPSMRISGKYSDSNPSRRGLYITSNSNRWHLYAQLAYISARRARFALQRRGTPTLKTDVIVSRRHAAIIVTIPKCGSRSLLAAFLDRWSEPEGVWSETTSLDLMLDRGLFRGGYCVLAVVRNPWDRAYSCYRDRIARLDRTRRHAHLIARYRGLRPFMPFEAFVEWLGSDEGADEWADRHWASQSAFLRVRNEYRCDQFFKLEQIAGQMDRLRCVLSEPDLHVPQITSFGNTSSRRDLYNSRTRGIIERRYEEDIDRFQYVF
jgi:Sulfotransferase family